VAETKRCPEPQRAALWTVDQDESGARTIRDERGELRARYHDAAGMAVGLVFALQSVQHEKQARERAEAENKRAFAMIVKVRNGLDVALRNVKGLSDAVWSFSEAEVELDRRRLREHGRGSAAAAKESAK